MKRTSILFCLLFAIAANLFNTAKAQVNTTDSLALVDLYNSTNGPHWYNHTNWLTTNPVSTWYGVYVTGNRVTSLILYVNRLAGSLPSSIGNLVQLNTLTLTDSKLSGAIPTSIGNLVNLNSLVLTHNKLIGTIPTSIGNLVNLVNLDLSNNKLKGRIPESIGNLVQLSILSITFNKLHGAIPASIGNLVNLRYLNLYENKLSGSIPETIGNLVNLYGMSLQKNQLSGSIPESIGNLVNLKELYLIQNQLSGSIPESIGNLTSMTKLELNNNLLSGPIPNTIGNLINLELIFLENNHLSGSIPESIGKLRQLGSMTLNANQLSGTIPASFRRLKRLEYLDISHNYLTQDEKINLYPDTHYSPFYVNNNLFNFNLIESLAETYHAAIYAPQNTILPIHQYGNMLSVYAGGTLRNNTYKWYKHNGLVATITGDSTFAPPTRGKYYVHVTNAIARKLTLYSDTITYTAQQQVIIASSKISNTSFSVYPNPASNNIHVQTNGNANIVLTNSSGKIVLTKNINNNDVINVSKYANGVYYIQNKTTGETQKIVVVH